ncbi:MAG: hypothetical protein IJM53_06485 [Lachnospiraceae bacterium]|nr:hypothetical protein [Lachnospiraceae bacterium]
MDYDDKYEEHIKPEDFEVDKKEEKRRARERARMNKKFKFSDKKHSLTGIISSCLALTALILLILAIILAVAAKGYGGRLVGALGTICFLCSLAGVVLGLVSFHKTDVLLKYAWIGTISSGVVWVMITCIIMIGI